MNPCGLSVCFSSLIVPGETKKKKLNKTLALSINHCFQPAWSEKRKKNHLHDFHL